MKHFLIIGILSFLFSACTQSTGTEQAVKMTESDAKVTVYYFHGKMRCATCVALQKTIEEAVAENFAGNTDVAFLEIDFSNKANAALAEKYEIAFSSVIIAGKNEHKDITDQSFALVNRNPDELKRLIAEETNAFLNK
jgi:thiol-disulfide isomerase/thioredoxin